MNSHMCVRMFIYVFKEKHDMVPDVLFLTVSLSLLPSSACLDHPRVNHPPPSSCCSFVFGGPCPSCLRKWQLPSSSCSGQNLEV